MGGKEGRRGERGWLGASLVSNYISKRANDIKFSHVQYSILV